MNASSAALSTCVKAMPAGYRYGRPFAVCSRRAHNNRPWQKQGASSDNSVKVTMFDGGHFYVNQHIDAIAELLASYACEQSA